MEPKAFNVNNLKVASPCSVAWDSMSGTERSRYCQLCKLNVYNIAGMTRSEVETMIATREGRLCIRMLRRRDGTVITSDCPVGLRAYQKRVARFAGAVLASLLGLVSVSFAQKESRKSIDASKAKIERVAAQNDINELTVTVVDPNGALVTGAKVRILKKGSVEASGTSNEEGVFSISNLLPFDKYDVEISGAGFETVKLKSLQISSNERVTFNVTLEPSGEIMGIFIDDGPLIEMNSPSITTTITRRQIENLPIGK